MMLFSCVISSFLILIAVAQSACVCVCVCVRMFIQLSTFALKIHIQRTKHLQYIFIINTKRVVSPHQIGSYHAISSYDMSFVYVCMCGGANEQKSVGHTKIEIIRLMTASSVVFFFH